MKLKKVPLAVTEEGRTWSLPFAYLIIYGTTGLGKGSVIQGVLCQVAFYVKDGTTRIYGIDSKNIELTPFEQSSLLTSYWFVNFDIESLIAEVHKFMKFRVFNKKVNLKNAAIGQSLDCTTDMQPVPLVIDEMFSISFVPTRTKSGK